MITPEQLEAIAEQVRSLPLDHELVPALCDLFPNIHFTYCMDDDICEVRPAMETKEFNLYYIDGNEHCLKFTPYPEAATGIVIAEVLDDE